MPAPLKVPQLVSIVAIPGTDHVLGLDTDGVCWWGHADPLNFERPGSQFMIPARLIWRAAPQVFHVTVAGSDLIVVTTS